MPSELEAAQQRSWVTYSTIIADKENDISILENRSVISGSGTTGLRTWEAALHLGSYLLSSPEAANYILGKQVVELGAGSGFISILCAKVLRASGVVATDGSPEVVATLKTNVEANQCDDKVSTGVLRWGWHLQETVLDSASLQENVHTVLGADVTYDQSVIPALVSTIRHVFERWPSANVIISATIRNEATFASFERACGMSVKTDPTERS
ncbi:Protein-lysine N-methyltransferase EFM3-like protein [Elsinoe fawcettii]|nr:Protein-lysine N-methyltransferase EFM3-like protein [Elsinoe fawcettii]